jgi:carbamoyltransferase
MITWGISANSHNAALAVFSNNSLVFASESERFSRIKNDPYINESMINHALSYGEPELICWYEDPLKKRLRQIVAGQGPFINNFTKYFNCKHKVINHHYSHACAGYFTSKFLRSAILVIDAIGEFKTLSIWEANGPDITLRYQLKYPNSIGLWYSAMTKRCGFKPNEEEYILMALSAYGDKDKLKDDILNELIDENFNCKMNFHRGCGNWKPNESIEDIAAGTQEVYELLFKNALKLAKKLVNTSNLTLVGGCALNCVANRHAYDYFKNVWIVPAPGDAGSAIGSVLAHKKVKIPFTPYLGYKILQRDSNQSIVNYLLENKVCGLARGRAEFGPRALGARSLLADPTAPNIKDRVNEIKNRQQYRPFSPVVPIEYAAKYFDMHSDMIESPYMQYAVKCKMPELLHGIVHVDGTSRVQTVRKSDAPRLHELLLRWGKATGHPVLLNTSLNIKGEPIVNDEVDCERWSKVNSVHIFS